MARRGRPIPLKLKHDAIVEAVVEIRFEMSSKTVPEVFFGRLAEYGPWKDLDPRPMPASQIPAQIRRADANLRYQPVFELAALDKSRCVRMGPQVLSYHRLRPYNGWEGFQLELTEAVDGLFSKSKGVAIKRLGLRYMNALQSDLHRIKSVSDLDLKISIAEEPAPGSVNINFIIDAGPDTECKVAIATPGFVQGNLPANTTVFVDVDVYTKNGFKSNDQGFVTRWIKAAHSIEKEQFFRLLTDETIDLLEVK
jgi:uncharacterized protein (TIGR04255 family)